jgi:hypothetical protein
METNEGKTSINDIDFTDTSNLKVVYILHLGKNSDGFNVYHFLLSEDCENTFMEDWAEKPSSNIPNDLLLIDDSQYEYVKELKTDITLDLQQDNTCFSFQDCRDQIVALAYENLDDAEFYPEPFRIVIHFGDYIDDVERMFAQRDMRMKFV